MANDARYAHQLYLDERAAAHGYQTISDFLRDEEEERRRRAEEAAALQRSQQNVISATQMNQYLHSKAGQEMLRQRAETMKAYSDAPFSSNYVQQDLQRRQETPSYQPNPVLMGNQLASDINSGRPVNRFANAAAEGEYYTQNMSDRERKAYEQFNLYRQKAQEAAQAKGHATIDWDNPFTYQSGQTRNDAERRAREYATHLQQVLGVDAKTLMQNADYLEAAQNSTVTKEDLNRSPYVKKQLENLAYLRQDAQTVRKGEDAVARFPAGGKTDLQGAKAYQDALQEFKEKHPGWTDEQIESAMGALSRTQVEEHNHAVNSIASLSDEQADLLGRIMEPREISRRYNGAGGPMALVTGRGQIGWNPRNAEEYQAFVDSFGGDIDTAERYIQYAAELQDETVRGEHQELIRSWTQDGPLAKRVLASIGLTAYDVAASPIAGYGGIEETFRSRRYADPLAPVNTNSAANELSAMSSDIEQTIGENFGDSTGGKIARFAYNVGTSTAKSMYSAAIGQGIGSALGMGGQLGEKAIRVVQNAVTLPSFGAGAYSQTLEEAQKRGITGTDAILTAAVSGMAEMATEIVSLDKVWDIMSSKGVKAAKNVITDAIVQAGIEGSEEVASDLINLAADSIINADKSEYNQTVRQLMAQGMSEEDAKRQATKQVLAEIASDFLAGSASGGASGMGANVGRVAAGNTNSREMFSNGYEGAAETFAPYLNSQNEEIAKYAKEGTELANRLEEKQKNGEKIKAGERRRLYNLVNEVTGADVAAASDTRAFNRTVDAYAEQLAREKVGSEAYDNMSEKEQQKAMRAERKEARGHALREYRDAMSEFAQAQNERREALKNNSEENLYDRPAYGPASVPENYRTQVTEATSSDVSQKITEAKTAEDLVAARNEGLNSTVQNVPAMAERLYRVKSEQLIKDGTITRADLRAAEKAPTNQDLYLMGANEQEASGLTEAQQVVYNEGVMRRQNDQASLRLRSNEEVRGRIVEVGENAKVQTDQGVQDASAYMPESDAGQRLYKHALNMDTAAAANLYLETLPDGAPVASHERYFDEMYNVGRIGARTFEQAIKGREWLVNKYGKETLQRIYDQGRTDAGRTEEETTGPVRKKGSGKVLNRETAMKNSTLRAMLPFAEAVAKKTGLDIEMNDELAGNIQGEFNRTLSKIVLNVNSDSGYSTLFHELGEFIKAYDQKAYTDLRNAILDYWYETEGNQKTNARALAMRDIYRRAAAKNKDLASEANKTIEDAADELINDAISGVFATEKSLKAFTDYLAEQGPKGRTLLQKFADFFKALAETLRSLASGDLLSNRSAISLAFAGVDRANQIRQAFLSGLESATKAYQQTEVGQVQTEQKSYSLTEDSTGRELTEGQREYFKDSKVVDENGRLKVMYHGSRSAGFTVFDPRYSDDKISLFFTDHPSVAQTYSGTDATYSPDEPMSFDELREYFEDMTGGDYYLERRADGKVAVLDVLDEEEQIVGSLKEAQAWLADNVLNYEVGNRANYQVYLNLTNPLIVEGGNRSWDELLDKSFVKNRVISAGVVEEDDGRWKLYSEESDGSHEEIVTTDELVKRYGEAHTQELIRGDDLVNLYLDENGNDVPQNTRDWAEYAREHGYDGVIFNNIIDEGIYGGDGQESQVVIAFSPEQIKSVNNENPTEDPDIRYSIDTMAESVGMTFEKEGSVTVLRDGNGKRITRVTPEMVRDTQLGAMISSGVKNGFVSQDEVTAEHKFISDLMNQMLKTQDLDLVFAVNSVLGFQELPSGPRSESMKNPRKSKNAGYVSNSDPQYSSTIDFTTICVKSQAIIDAMSETMKRLGRGLSEEEIINVVYKNTHEAGEPVPCPVCYVFSRWVGLGGLFDKMNNLQKKYANADVKKIRADMADLDRQIAETQAKLDGKKKSRGKAKDKLYKQLKEELRPMENLEKAEKLGNKVLLTDEQRQRMKTIRHQIELLDNWTWLSSVRLAKNYKPVPPEILFDINAGTRFANEYPESWKYRTTRGPAMGKAATPYADQHIGQTIRGISSPSAMKNLGDLTKDPMLFQKEGKNYIPVEGGKLTSVASGMITRAIKKARVQNLLNGQRIQSTSDFRFEYMLDYLLAFYELQTVGSKVQLYTKVPESVGFFASVNSEVNCSLMPFGVGYETDADGNPVYDKDGRLTLLFSDVTGMHPDDAFRLSSMYDNVQPIVVGTNNIHIRGLLADPRISFVIPYHASGSNETRYQWMMQIVGESVKAREDYSAYQTDIAKADATPAQKAANQLRKDIVTGKAKSLTKEQKAILAENEILHQLYQRFYGKDMNGNTPRIDNKYLDAADRGPNGYGTVDHNTLGTFMTASQAGTIMPYEFWDKSLTLDEADQNSAIFAEYCESLGLHPRFSGHTAQGTYKAEYDFTKDPGYWKLIPDRRMYNRDGTYHEQKAINMANMRMDYLDRAKTVEGIVKPSVENDRNKVEMIAQKSVEEIQAQENQDIRRSIYEDEDGFIRISEDDYNRWLEDETALFNDDGTETRTSFTRESVGRAVSMIAEGNKILTEQAMRAPGDVTAAREKTARQIARRILRDYQSAYDAEKLAKNLDAAFAYMQQGSNVDYEELLQLVTEIAQPVLDKPKQVLAGAEEYAAFRRALASTEFSLNDTQKAEVASAYDSYGNFRRRLFGVVNVSNKATSSLDMIWDELCEKSWGMLDPNTSDAEMPLALMDAIETMRPTVENAYGGNTHDMAYDMALDIIGQYFQIQQQEALQAQAKEQKGKEKAKLAARMAKVNERLKAEKADYRKQVQARYNERLQKAREELKGKRALWEEKYHDAIRMRDEKLAEMAAKNRNTMREQRDRRLASQEREQIRKIGKDLIDTLNNPTDKKHIPQGMRQPISEFLSAIDFLPARAQEGSRPTRAWQERMRSLQTILNNIASKNGVVDDDMSAFEYTLDPDIAATLNSFLERNGGLAKLSDLDYEGVHELKQMLTAIRAAVSNANKMIASEHEERVSDLANGTFEDLAKRKDEKDRTGIGRFFHNLLHVSMLDSFSYFEGLGKSANKVYRAIRDGFDRRAKHLKDAQEWFAEASKGFSRKDFQNMMNTRRTFKGIDGEVSLSVSQIMSLYELMKRQQARDHITLGGIKSETYKEKGRTIEQKRPVHFSKTQLQEMFDALTDEQKALADRMQEFMGKEAGSWGNRVTMAMYGYEKFGEEHYFPIKTDKNSLAVTDRTEQNDSVQAIRNMSASKETVKGARNALMIGDIFEVFSNHVADMATYDGFVMPLADAMRWFNYKFKYTTNEGGSKFDITRSVQEEISRVMGSYGRQYFTNLMKDINGMTSAGHDSQFGDTLLSNFKAAAVGANLRVAVQQPTAYMRAMAMMNPKYLLAAMPGAVNPRTLVHYAKKANQNSMIAWWKSQGYFETNLGKTNTQIITGQATMNERIREASAKLAELGDTTTWGTIYHAVELEQKAAFKKAGKSWYTMEDGKKAETAEFTRAVVARFNDIIDHTQVVDSVLHRSQFMRSKNGLVKLEAAFQSEPTKSFNMLFRAFSTKKGRARIVATFALTNLLTAAVASMADAFRYNDDDDKSWLERWMEALFGVTGEEEGWYKKMLAVLTGNLGDQENPFGLIPYVKDAFSVMGGFDSTRSDLVGIENSVKAVQEVLKFASGDSKKTPYGLIKALSQGFSQLTGVPAYAALREFETGWNTLGDIFGFAHLQTKIESSARKRDYGRLYDAINKGGDITGTVQQLILDGKNVKDIRSAITTEYKDAWKEAEDKSQIEESVTAALQAMSMSEDEIQTFFAGWGKETVTYAALDDAIDAGGDVAAAVQEMLDGGKTPKAITSHLQNAYAGQLRALNDISPEAAEDLKNDLTGALQAAGAEDPAGIVAGWASGEVTATSANVSEYAGMKDAISSGGDVRGEVDKLLSSGKDGKTVKTTITRAYKDEMIELYKTDKTAATELKQKLISAYMAAGETWQEANDKINKWIREG